MEDQDFDIEDPSEEDAEVQAIIDQGQKAFSIVENMLSTLNKEDKETLKVFLQNVIYNDSAYIPNSENVISAMFDMLSEEWQS